LIKAALRQAEVAPHTVSYIEAHGTGTALGDPIEVQGLKSAFKELAQEHGQPELATDSCALGTVKSNIGHLELAAGVAGVIKTVLQLRHRTLVKSLHSEPLNPLIELKDSPFYIARETQRWQVANDAAGRPLPRRAGVSSFGFGGVNAHVVLEEYIGPEQGEAFAQRVASPTDPSIVVLSAKNEERLTRLPKLVVQRIIQEFGGLEEVLAASDEDLEAVEGVGSTRAKDIREGVRRLQEIDPVDRYLQS
jgi:acyl transferase domain-containing protein